MDVWRQRLHSPAAPDDITPDLRQTLSKAHRILLPSLTDPTSQATSLLVIAPPQGGKSLFTRLLTDSLTATLHSKSTTLVTVSLDAITTSPTQVWRELALALSLALNPTSTTDDLIEDPADDPSLIRPALDRMRENSQPLLLVLDHFHRLATPDPIAQTVLYTLFNLLQDRSLRAACIALTAVVDVSDLLEKRIKSRFAGRPVILPQPRVVSEVTALIRTAFRLNINSDTTDNTSHINEEPTQPTRSRKSRRKSRRSSAASEPVVMEADRLTPAQILAEQLLQRSAFATGVSRHLARSRPVGSILRAMDAAVTAGLSVVDDNAVQEAERIFTDSISTPDPFLSTIPTLTERQRTLLVALCRLSGTPGQRTVAPGAPAGMRRVRFDDVYREYKRSTKVGDDGLLAEAAVENVVAPSIARRDWEALVECGLVIRSAVALRDAPAVYCAVNERLVFEAIRACPNTSATLRHWARPRTLQT